MAQKSFVFQVSSRKILTLTHRDCEQCPKVTLGPAGKDSSWSDAVPSRKRKQCWKIFHSKGKAMQYIWLCCSLVGNWPKKASESLSIMAQNQQVHPSKLALAPVYIICELICYNSFLIRVFPSAHMPLCQGFSTVGRRRGWLRETLRIQGRRIFPVFPIFYPNTTT